MKTIKFTLASALCAMVLSPFSMAESLADRRSEQISVHSVEHVVSHIQNQYGPTAAGPQDAANKHSASHEPMMPMKKPSYTSSRHKSAFHGLSAHEYRRKQFGSNN